VVFHDEFTDAVDAALSVLDQWDIVKLNFIRAKWPKQKLHVQKWECLKYLGASTGTGAYLINRHVVEKLLNSFLPIVRPIDHEIDRTHKHMIRHYGLVPFPSHVADNGQSTITGNNHSGVKKFSIYRRLPVYAQRLRNFTGIFQYSYRIRSS
jgi:glycosyl transferase family 25